MSIICVDHEKAFARQSADGVIFMDTGAIVEGAPRAEFFAVSRHEQSRSGLAQPMR